MSKILVIYYSAQGHTKNIAEKIAENLQADLFEITPEAKYTEEDLDWTNDNSRASREFANESERDVKLTTTDVPNWSDYDTILIGYPIWWGIAAWPANSFVKAQDFTGKTVIPFCTYPLLLPTHSTPTETLITARTALPETAVAIAT